MAGPNDPVALAWEHGELRRGVADDVRLGVAGDLAEAMERTAPLPPLP
jgi:hypothetical protein